MLITITILAYFAALLLLSKLTSRKATNNTFYRADRKSPWHMVAFGMIGASISGVTFISVPGMFIHSQMTYLQMCMGFIPGYFAVALILLPVYYRLNLTSIYTYLEKRFGIKTYHTGSWFFILSQITGQAVKFFVVCVILQQFVFQKAGIPFPVTVISLVLLVWLYSRKGGIKTLVWTDSFQTFCMLAALVLIIYYVIQSLGMNFGQAVHAITGDASSRIFVFDDWISKQNFWKQFVSGIFVVVVMTGLDQNNMQKNLTCKTLKDAQKNMCSYGFAFVPVNLLFLSLGCLLMILADKQSIAVDIQQPDMLLPMFAASGLLGNTVVVLFTIGIIAASFSSVDSALTALTTAYCVDIKGKSEDERLRKKVHFGMAVMLIVFILLFKTINSTSAIDAIYILVSYTYGPLLGMFAFGLLTKRATNDNATPYIAAASPVICYILNGFVARETGYQFGYELLIINGLLTFIGLYVFKGGNKDMKSRTHM